MRIWLPQGCTVRQLVLQVVANVMRKSDWVVASRQGSETTAASDRIGLKALEEQDIRHKQSILGRQGPELRRRQALQDVLVQDQPRSMQCVHSLPPYRLRKIESTGSNFKSSRGP